MSKVAVDWLTLITIYKGWDVTQYVPYYQQVACGRAVSYGKDLNDEFQVSSNIDVTERTLCVSALGNF
jgi:hypothetical protein